MPTYFRRGEWSDWYAVNAMELSKFCLARGRYEIANELHLIGTENYERTVVLKQDPNDTPKDREHYREVLAAYKDHLSEFPKLFDTKARLLAALSDHPKGIERGKLSSKVKHAGATTFGVICNQLARGGWLRQEKSGDKFILYPESNPPSSDAVFVETEIPTPDKLESQAVSASPIATLNVKIPQAGRFGCLPRLFGLLTVVLTLIHGLLVATK
jgi:hypothetical protein